MAGDRFKRAKPGDPLTIPAAAYNAFLDAAEDVRNQSSRPAATPRRTHGRPGTVLVRNDTGGALDVFAVLEIGDVLVSPDDAPTDARTRTAFAASTPGDEPGPLAITQEPLAAGAIGRALVYGVTPVRLHVSDDTHTYAEAETGETARLASSPSAGARVLYKQSTDGETDAEVWAVVYYDPASAENGPREPDETETIGADEEGNEAAETDSFTVGTDGKGLDLWTLSRIGYFHAGDKTLYAYARKLTVDETGRIYSIGAETRVSVDVAVAES